MWTLIRRVRAWLGGYYWKPCTICGRMYGGFEAADEVLIYSVEGSVSDKFFMTRSHMVCRACGPEAARRNFATYGIIQRPAVTATYRPGLLSRVLGAGN